MLAKKKTYVLKKKKNIHFLQTTKTALTKPMPLASPEDTPIWYGTKTTLVIPFQQHRNERSSYKETVFRNWDVETEIM